MGGEGEGEGEGGREGEECMHASINKVDSW